MKSRGQRGQRQNGGRPRLARWVSRLANYVMSRGYYSRDGVSWFTLDGVEIKRKFRVRFVGGPKGGK